MQRLSEHMRLHDEESPRTMSEAMRQRTAQNPHRLSVFIGLWRRLHSALESIRHTVPGVWALLDRVRAPAVARSGGRVPRVATSRLRLGIAAVRMHAERDTYLVLLIGMFSGLLYLATYFAQQAMFDYSTRPASPSGIEWWVGAYYCSTVGLFALYAWLIVLCRHGVLSSRLARCLVFAFPIVFNVGLLLTRPYLSFDVLSYIGHGYLGVTPGANPYVDPVRDVAMMPIGQRLAAYGWQPAHGISPYGPLWTNVEIAVVRWTQDIPTAILLIKGVIVAASLCSGALIWSILGRIRSADQLLGTLSYLWCPMIVIEFAGEGHNDALMVVLVLLALALAVRNRLALSIVGMMLGTLVKYVPLIFIPAQVVYLWRARRNLSHFMLHLLGGTLLGLGMAALLYHPLWMGTATFRGVQDSSQVAAAGPRVLFEYVFHHFLHTPPVASQMAMYALEGLFGVYVLVTSYAVHSPQDLLKVCARIALFYLFLAVPGYWPWYPALPVALMALWPQDALLWMIYALSLCSRLVAPLDQLRADGLVTLRVESWGANVIGLALPLFILLALTISRRRQWQSWVPQAIARTSLRVEKVVRSSDVL